MIFGYDIELLANKEIDIESLGNVCLEAIDSVNRCFYLWIKTVVGESTILEFGPIYKEDELLPNDYEITFKRIDYSDGALMKVIQKFFRPRKFIGNKKVKIEQVNFIDHDVALTYGINPFKYLQDYSDTSNY